MLKQITKNITINHEEITEPLLALYCGIYYEKNKNDYDKAKEYYFWGVKHGYAPAMNRLGTYYEDIEFNYGEIKKYYKMAIKNGYGVSCKNLGSYYQNRKIYDKAKKYFKMSFINLNYGGCLNLLASLCKNDNELKKEIEEYCELKIKKNCEDDMMNEIGGYYWILCDYNNALKYFLMVYEHNNENIYAIKNLAMYYKHIHNYEEAINYYSIGANLNDQTCIDNLNKYLIENKFIVSIAIKAYNVLNEENLKTLNSLICETYKLTNSMNEIFSEMDCLNCNKYTKCIFLKCGHPICSQCNKQNCRLCTKN